MLADGFWLSGRADCRASGFWAEGPGSRSVDYRPAEASCFLAAMFSAIGVAVITGGAGALAYLAAWVIIPGEGEKRA